MSDLFSLSGRRALITGAEGGIGQALALGLARQGADLVLHHFGSAAKAEALAEEIRAMGRDAAVIEADFAKAGAASAFADEVLKRLEPIDILIANAAIERRAGWEDVTSAEIDDHVAINFASLLHLMQKLLPPMADRGWGRLVAIGSVLADRPRAEAVVYAALKSAQLTAIQAIAREVAASGVTLNVVAPGAIETEANRVRYADPAFLKAVIAKIPAGRQGHPGDCVAPMLMLCSDAGGYVTGATIPVDGGWTIGDPPGALPEPGRRP